MNFELLGPDLHYRFKRDSCLSPHLLWACLTETWFIWSISSQKQTTVRLKSRHLLYFFSLKHNFACQSPSYENELSSECMAASPCQWTILTPTGARWARRKSLILGYMPLWPQIFDWTSRLYVWFCTLVSLSLNHDACDQKIGCKETSSIITDIIFRL